jgi:hypothetical protein
MCIFKKNPQKFQLHFKQNLLQSICSNFIQADAKLKVVQETFNTLA